MSASIRNHSQIFQYFVREREREQMQSPADPRERCVRGLEWETGECTLVYFRVSPCSSLGGQTEKLKFNTPDQASSRITTRSLLPASHTRLTTLKLLITPRSIVSPTSLQPPSQNPPKPNLSSCILRHCRLLLFPSSVLLLLENLHFRPELHQSALPVLI
jgi:hypothetical protein